MKLTELEEKIVLAHRNRVADAQAFSEKRKNCKHSHKVYRGEYRGESVYECMLCGTFIYE